MTVFLFSTASTFDTFTALLSLPYSLSCMDWYIVASVIKMGEKPLTMNTIYIENHDPKQRIMRHNAFARVVWFPCIALCTPCVTLHSFFYPGSIERKMISRLWKFDSRLIQQEIFRKKNEVEARRNTFKEIFTKLLDPCLLCFLYWLIRCLRVLIVLANTTLKMCMCARCLLQEQLFCQNESKILEIELPRQNIAGKFVRLNLWVEMANIWRSRSLAYRAATYIMKCSLPCSSLCKQLVWLKNGKRSCSNKIEVHVECLPFSDFFFYFQFVIP